MIWFIYQSFNRQFSPALLGIVKPERMKDTCEVAICLDQHCKLES